MNNTLKILRGLSVFGLMLSSAACSVEATNPAKGQAQEGTTTFAISDATGTSTATVTIRSDNPADLALKADDFELVAISGEKPGADAEGIAGGLAHESAASSSEAAEDDSASGTEIDISDEVLADGVVAVELVERDAPDYRAPFRDRYYYSLVNRVRTASVTRHAVFNRVYVSMYFNLVANGSWSTLLSDYKLSNKETKTREAPANTYQMRVKVRARNTNDYTTEFVE